MRLAAAAGFVGETAPLLAFPTSPEWKAHG